MGCACGMYWEEEKCIQSFGRKAGREQLQDLGISGRALLNLNLRLRIRGSGLD
jgi:hypothetical protein